MNTTITLEEIRKTECLRKDEMFELYYDKATDKYYSVEKFGENDIEFYEADKRYIDC